MNRIAIFASGSGTNAENIMNYFAKSEIIKVAIVLSNKPDAYVLERAKKKGVDSFVFTRTEFYDSEIVDEVMEKKSIDYIVLAGFLWLMPERLIQKFRRRIINIHPALLPKYGGKGMYGMRVHEAVIANNEKESGITVHDVNENYDEGKIIFNATCKIEPGETPETLAAKIHQLEYKYFPSTIEKWILKK
jgi:phosphoribosylglycinamide formyltransferase 1